MVIFVFILKLILFFFSLGRETHEGLRGGGDSTTGTTTTRTGTKRRQRPIKSRVTLKKRGRVKRGGSGKSWQTFSANSSSSKFKKKQKMKIIIGARITDL